MGAVRPNVGAMVNSVIILSLRPVRPMRPDAQDGKCIFRDVKATRKESVKVIEVVVLEVLPPLWTNIAMPGRSHHCGRAATPSVSLRLV